MSFKMTTLGEYAKVQGGFAYKSKDFIRVSEYRVLKIRNVRFGTIDYSEPAFVPKSIAESTNNWKLKEGDILISMTGSGPNAPQSLVGRVARVWKNEPYAWFNQRVGRINLVDNKKIHPDFLFYWLSLPHNQDFLVANSSGSANQANISGKTIESLPTPIVDYEISSAIAKIARELDEKIILNNQTNQTLEQIAQAIFKSWFVDFDPVKAKIEVLAAGGSVDDAELASMSVISAKTLNELNGLKASNSEAFNKLAQTAALFPAAMQDSELGEIPRGWEVKQLSEICQVINGRAYKNTEFKTEGTPIVRIQNLSNGGKTVYSDLELPPEKYIDREDFIYAWSATFGPHIWRGPKSIYHYHIWKMEVDESVISRYFLYLSMFRKTEAMKNAGTGSIFTHLTKKIMESQHILIGDQATNKEFSDIIVPIFDQISSLKNESTHLADIRDALLPKLLTGDDLISEVANV